MYMFCNGAIIKESKARISPFDHGFLYGLGVFETFRLYDGHPFLLDDHLDRLNASLKELNIDSSVNRTEITRILDKLISANRYNNARIRLNVSAGNSPMGLQTSPFLNPNMLVFMSPIIVQDTLQEKKAILLKTPRNTPETGMRLKSHHFLNNIAAKREIADLPVGEGIFLTENGFIAEGIISNLFWVKDSTIFTPDTRTGILNGITRQWIIKYADLIGLRCEEGFFSPADLARAEEVFYTNSVQEIVSISSIDSVGQYKGKNGSVTVKLYQGYQRVKKQIWSRNELCANEEIL
ncbi:4-amino-4-deoxychorismate lyase [Peribacillus saganii]|uniref:4-amino-4-deoxychorismate lyase n=1 Tax=Peribacillus saganii TaxID=2303992 RepID=A0A372LK55_9BACI|nr:aminodeoxychorismate lyase [Peribacillus saganii]RFU66898.1 4-amino-4-deoxychorismate lyase [Peribacillus saganii]